MQATYLRLISAITFALALVTSAALHFYIERVRVSLAELPSAMQVDCGVALLAPRSYRPCLLKSLLHSPPLVPSPPLVLSVRLAC